MTDLPAGWTWATLHDLQADEPGAITDGPFGSNLTSAHYTEQGPRVVRLQNIGDGTFNNAEAHISEVHFHSLRKHEVRGGDLLVASLGETLPRACLAPFSLGPAIVKADCIRVRLSDAVDPRWVMYALQTPTVRKWAREQLHGVGRPRLGLKVIRALPVPLPPLEHQRRIVNLLEDHLSRLDAAEKCLREAHRRLDSLEQSVLSDCYQLGELQALGTLSAIQGGIQKQPKRAPADNAFPFLRVANVTAGGLELDEVHSVELFEGELDKLRLQAGDLLVVEGNGSPSQIGRAALWDDEIENCVHQNHLIRVRPQPDVLPAYLEAVWNAPQNRRQLTALSSSSSGLHTLSVGKLKALKIPVATEVDQQAVIARIGEIRAGKDRQEAALDELLRRGGQLRRSLLAAAFSGQLANATTSRERARV